MHKGDEVKKKASDSINMIDDIREDNATAREEGDAATTASRTAFLQQLVQIDRYTVWRGKVMG